MSGAHRTLPQGQHGKLERPYMEQADVRAYTGNDT